MNKKSIFSVIILFLVLSITIGFSAFASEMSISKIVADVRVKSDIRITEIGISGGNISGGYDGLNWDADSVMLGDLISGKGDFVNLEVTVTNFGNSEMGIYDIVVPEGIDFEISNYDMESKICNTSGKCNLGISKTLNFKVSNNNYSDVSKSVKIDFDFRKMHTVIYEEITNNGYPTSVIDGGYLSVNFRNDIPENVVVYNSGIKLDSSKYDYSDNDLTVNNVTGDLVIKSAKNLFNIIKLKTNGVDTNIDFSLASSENNGDGVNTVSGTENDQYPVYYYRGNVTDNNLIFANKCWKMVRTTETGGIKLIYNGVPAEDGSCNNTGTASRIGQSAFNSYANSLAYMGYMYGTVYEFSSINLSVQSTSYLYGNYFTWNGDNYTLLDTKTSSSWVEDKSTLAKKYHYTCFNSTGVCETVYYVYYSNDEHILFYLTLSGGKDIEIAKTEMFNNENDSEIKKYVDTWFKKSISSFSDFLEDTVWCNDRELDGGALFNKDTSLTGYTSFSVRTRNVINYSPKVSCTNKQDSFTVSNEFGNQKLTYPVGLLTADEYTMAGSGFSGYSSDSYLYENRANWLLSPYYMSNDIARGFNINQDTGSLFGNFIDNVRDVRPSISLKVGTLITSGDGTTASPYIVE